MRGSNSSGGGPIHTLRGITSRLSSVFWPTYRYAETERGDGARKGGLRRGREGDRIVTAIVDRVCVRASAQSARDGALVLRALRANGWQPERTQVHVHMAPLGLHTWVDILAKTKGGGVVIVEQKIGYHNGSWRAGNDAMRHELGFASNCPLHQAFAQLAVTCALYEFTFRKPVKVAVVVHVSNAGVAWHVLPDAYRKCALSITNRIRAR